MNNCAKQFLAPTILTLSAGILAGCDTAATHPEAYTAWKPHTNATVIAALSENKTLMANLYPSKSAPWSGPMAHGSSIWPLTALALTGRVNR